MSNLSAKAARIAKAKKRARAFLSAQSTVEFSTHPILDHSGLTEAINTLILKERVPGTAAEWLTAITSELKEVESRRLTPLTTDEIAAIPRGTAVRLRMRLVRKKDGRFKARLLVQGFREPITWDVGGSDSPTASLVSVRSLLFMRGYKHDVISSIDVSTAFLQADEYEPDAITRHVYYQPGPHMPRVYYKLRGCLYGQRTASMEWYRTPCAHLVSEGFRVGKNDPCVYVNPITKVRLVVVVDDILCRGSCKATEAFYTALAARFKVQEPTFLTLTSIITYCGLDISLTETLQKGQHPKSCISISQKDDMEAFLAEIPGLPSLKAVNNPMPSKYAFMSNPELLSGEDIDTYRSYVGVLNYYACTLRYDIAYPTSRLSQFSAHPTIGSMTALMHVLAYLKCHTDFAIHGNMHNDTDAHIMDHTTTYSDSHHAGLRAYDSHSQSGMFILLNGVPVCWKSNKQVSISTSSACAEIYALSDAVKYSRLFQWRGQELGMDIPNPISVQVDNMQAKSLASSTCLDSKLRGIFDIREDWVLELRQRDELFVDYVQSEHNIADLLTKSHTTARYQQLLGKIGDKANTRHLQKESIKLQAAFIAVAAGAA